MDGLAEPDALPAIGQSDELVAEQFQVPAPAVADYGLATAYIPHLPTRLRAGDALHLAIARSHGAKPRHTRDAGLLNAARLPEVRASRIKS